MEHSADAFFAKTYGPEDREVSRPKYINPNTGKMQSWQRASNFAAPLESPFGLIKYQTRNLVTGVNSRPDLARMLLAGAVSEMDKVDELISSAHAAAELDAKANNGTAVHAALALCDTGKTWPEEFNPHVRSYVAELKRHGLRPVAVEQRILNTRLNATGTFDRIYVTESGRYLTGDVKTGRLDRGAHKFAVQCEVYAGADYLVHEQGAASTTEPIPWVIDQDAALLVHVDPDTGATSVYEVPLRVARWGAALAEQVRAFQRTDVLLPYSGAPAGPLLADVHRGAATEAATQIPGKSVDLTARAESAPEPQSAPSAVPAVMAVGSDEYQARLDELLKPKNDKAALQRMASDLGCRDLAHHRKWLATWIIDAEIALAEGGHPQVAGPAAAQVAQTIEQGVPAAESTPFTLKQIADASSVDDIRRLRENIVARSGDQAWTPAMTEIAKQRVAELDEDDTQRTMNEIAVAVSTQELGAIWERVTAGGALVSKWTDQINSAAQAQAAKITEAAPAAPSNPWGSN